VGIDQAEEKGKGTKEIKLVTWISRERGENEWLKSEKSLRDARHCRGTSDAHQVPRWRISLHSRPGTIGTQRKKRTSCRKVKYER